MEKNISFTFFSNGNNIFIIFRSTTLCYVMLKSQENAAN